MDDPCSTRKKKKKKTLKNTFVAIEFRKWFFYLNLAKWRLILLKVKGPGPSVRHPLDSEKCDNFQLQFFLILGNFNFTVLFLPDKISKNILFDVLANHIEKTHIHLSINKTEKSLCPIGCTINDKSYRFFTIWKCLSITWWLPDNCLMTDDCLNQQ